MGDVIERLNVVPRRCTRNIKLVSILLSGLRHTAWLSMVIFAMLIVATRTGMAEQSERPGESGPTEIQASIIMLDLDSVNDANQSFEAAVYVELSWEDPSVLEDGATADDAWRPLVAISNQQQKWDVLPETLVIEADGRVRMRRSIWGSFSQPLDLRRFPFDSQEFSVTLLAEAGPEEIVFIQNADRPSGISSSLSVPDWNIQNTRSEGRFFYVSENIDPIPSFAMTVSAERRVQYYVYTMILPLVVIVAMSFVTFWIEPANFGTRLAVASTSMSVK